MKEEELIYDWNGSKPQVAAPPLLVDHTLAGARLTPWLPMPSSQDQEKVLPLLAQLGLRDICLGSWSDPQVRALAAQVQPLSLRGWVETPLPPLGPPASLGAYVSHRYRNWRELCLQAQGPVTLVIQDVTRCGPRELVALLRQLPGTSVSGCCLSDDGGRSTPAGTQQLLTFVQQALAALDLPLALEWSGRNDRGLALANALAAWQAGAGVLHCSFFGLGEGSGLVPCEQLIVNLCLLGALDRDYRSLSQVSQTLAQLLGVTLHPNLPVLGADAFRTGTGVHAAAIMKAHKKGHDWLADLIYSGVPAAQFGFHQIIEVGPMAGASNVQHWLQQKGIEPRPDLVQTILQRAKESAAVLPDEEIWKLVRA